MQAEAATTMTDGDFTYVILDDETIQITGYTGTALNVTVPSVISRRSVTSIADSAFDATDSTVKKSIIEITLPNSITSIGASAFKNCSNLKKIKLSDNLTSIGASAFYGCNSLKDIQLPESVTGIGESAFYGCSSLKSIQLPESVTGIMQSTFYGCSSLSEVSLPDGITTIYESAFYGCSSLKSIELPAELVNIYPEAFYGCSGLVEIQIPETVYLIGPCAFQDCSSLRNIRLPEGVTGIYPGVFMNCSSLSEVYLPEGLKSIGISAFYGCSSLTELYLPDGLESIGYWAFKDCSSLQRIDFQKNNVRIASSQSGFVNYYSDVYRNHYTFYNCGYRDSSNVYYSTSYSVFENCSNLAFYGYLDSSAETYAAHNDIPFVEKNDISTDSDFCMTYAEDSFAEDVVLDEIKLQASELSEGNSSYDKINPENLFTDDNPDALEVLYQPYEITVTDKDGQQVQPVDKVTLKIPCPDGYDGSNCKVYYMDEDGTLTDMQAAWNYEYLSFRTQKLGTYVVATLKSATIFGDVDGDESISLMDSALIRRYLAGWDVEINLDAADVDGDGSITLMDSAVVRRYLAGWNVTIRTK